LHRRNHAAGCAAGCARLCCSACKRRCGHSCCGYCCLPCCGPTASGSCTQRRCGQATAPDETREPAADAEVLLRFRICSQGYHVAAVLCCWCCLASVAPLLSWRTELVQC
jgi:hypothetical protein